jgi:gas vesicle protein
MNVENRSDPGFLLGLLAGSVVGAGLAMLFAPRAGSEVRQRITDSAKELGNRASERYQQVSTRVGEAVGDLTTKGQSVRDDMADAVVGGAQEVARRATAIKTERDTKKHSVNDRPPSGNRS